MPAVIRLQAMSASSWYMSCAGKVPPLQTRWLSSHSLGDAFELAEQMQLWFLARIAPLVSSSRWSDGIGACDWRTSARCLRFRSTSSPMMPALRVMRRADQIGRQIQSGIVVEIRR